MRGQSQCHRQGWLSHFTLCHHSYHNFTPSFTLSWLVTLWNMSAPQRLYLWFLIIPNSAYLSQLPILCLLFFSLHIPHSSFPFVCCTVLFVLLDLLLVTARPLKQDSLSPLDLIILFYPRAHFVSYFLVLHCNHRDQLQYVSEDSRTFHFPQCQLGLTLIMIFSKSSRFTAEAHLCKVHLNS